MSGMELGYVVAAAIAAGPATLAAIRTGKVDRKIQTNHGKDIGQHVEDLVDWAQATSVSMQAHQDSDNDLREVFGLPRTEIEFPKVDGLEVHHE